MKVSNASLDNFDQQLIHPFLYQTAEIAGGKGSGIGLAWKLAQAHESPTSLHAAPGLLWL